jgi:beta-galactosidase/beta-glucuronidase
MVWRGTGARSHHRAIPPGHCALVRFESVDYAAKVWLNGYEIGSHEGEGPFELDVTERVQPERANLLAVRVVNPTGEAIDGLVLSEVPHANKTLPEDFRPGWAYNFGGILGDVVVHVEPEARLLDVVVRSQLATGVITVDVTVSPAASRREPMAVNVLVSEAASGLSVASAQESIVGGRLA